MYIPIWLVIISGLIAFWYFRNENSEKKIEKLEKTAYWLYKMSLEKSDNPIVYDILDDDEERLKKTEEKYIRLKEKFKHEPKMQLKLAIDWKDYCLNMHSKVLEWKKFGVNLEDSAQEEYDEGIKEHQLIIEEIEKKFDKLLKE